jgi:oligoendopeptidase F
MQPLQPPIRTFLPKAFQVSSWAQLKPFFDNLLNRSITSDQELRQWLRDRSELESVIAEDLGWRYINMTRFTDNEEYGNRYQEFIQHIQPELAVVADQLNKKLVHAPGVASLEREQGFDIYFRLVKKEIELFREANVPLFTEISTEQQRYNQVAGAMTITWEEQEITLPQASVLLMSADRAVREQVYRRVAERRLQDNEGLDQLFTRLVSLRHTVAVNAGFPNFRDYMFKSLGRFDYTPQDCFDFHASVQTEVVPLLQSLMADRQQRLGVQPLKPWDKAVDPEGRSPLKAFTDGKELIEKAITCFHRTDPYLGQCLEVMQHMGHLDLESRKGKAPGGYNYPLAEIGVPFIFMNATSTLRDMVTLMHEGGHAVHNFLTRDLELSDFKSPPSEIAELASMAMELISMDHWDIFFTNPDELVRAKREHLEDIIETLPWVATIDKFQHWVYEHHAHSADERKQNWCSIADAFSDTLTDWSDLPAAKAYLWQKQLHLYEVPFYYIEYGMAQLGAIAVWRNYKQDKRKGLEGYMNALRLGYTKSIPEVYKAAGIRFDFSRPYIRELMAFVKAELDNLD